MGSFQIAGIPAAARIGASSFVQPDTFAVLAGTSFLSTAGQSFYTAGQICGISIRSRSSFISTAGRVPDPSFLQTYYCIIRRRIIAGLQALCLRAEVDATLAANGGRLSGPVLCRDLAELTAIQHVGATGGAGMKYN